MRISTRIEIIDGYVYCAYCGKMLKDPNFGICPEPPTICNCEKAKEELSLYDKLKTLYNHPLADSIIEIKIDNYRRKLKGEHVSSTYVNTITHVSPCTRVIDTSDKSTCENLSTTYDITGCGSECNVESKVPSIEGIYDAFTD